MICASCMLITPATRAVICDEGLLVEKRGDGEDYGGEVTVLKSGAINTRRGFRWLKH